MVNRTLSRPTFTGLPSKWLGIFFGIHLGLLAAPIFGSAANLLQLWSIFDVLCLISAPWILRWYLDSDLGFVPVLAVLWPFGIVLSDFLNDTPWTSTAVDLLFAASYLIPVVAFPWLVHGRVDRFIPVGMWSFVGIAIFAWSTFAVTEVRDLWKFVLGGPLALMVALGLSRPRNIGSLHVPLVLGLVAVLSFALGARSLGGSMAIGAVVMTALSVRRGAKPTVAMLLAIVVGGGLVAVDGYTFAASTGILGETEQLRYQRIERAESGLIDSGRPQQPVSWMMVRERPVLGYGSNPALSPEQRVEALKIFFERGISLGDFLTKRVFGGEFQAHSILLDAWVRAGLLGALAIVALPFVAVLTLAREYGRRLPDQFLPFLACVLPTIAWDIYYSPVTPMSGVMLGLVLAALGVARNTEQSRRSV
jgi:hypothetical protein